MSADTTSLLTCCLQVTTVPLYARGVPNEGLSEALNAVGDRWTLQLVAALMDGPQRFGDLQTALPGIAPNVLTQRLRHLERHALAVPRAYSERPPRFVYELSEA